MLFAITAEPPQILFLAVLVIALLVWLGLLIGVGFNRRILRYRRRRQVPWGSVGSEPEGLVIGAFEVILLLFMHVVIIVATVGTIAVFGGHYVDADLQDVIAATELQGDEAAADPTRDDSIGDLLDDDSGSAGASPSHEAELAETAAAPADVVGSTETEAETESVDADLETELDRAHGLVKLLYAERNNPRVILLIFFVAVIAAPLSEEFFCRLLLQGYLESVEWQFLKSKVRFVRPMFGVMPIMLSSLLFASLHIRSPSADPNLDHIFLGIAGTAVGSILSLAFAITLLKLVNRAKLSDFGVVPSKIPHDCMIGLAAFMMVVIPVYAVQISLAKLLPDTVPDALALFPFACVLGFLYFRTHRIVPSIVLHMLLNFTSTMIAMAAIRAM